jgi:hypothetical protein
MKMIKQILKNILILILFSIPILVVSCSDDTKKENNNNDCLNSCQEWEECNSNNECSIKDGFCYDITNCSTDYYCDSNHKCIKEEETIFCIEGKCNEDEICDEINKRCLTTVATGKCQTNDDCEDGFTCNAEFIYTTIQNIQIDDSLIDKSVQTTGIVTAIALSQTRTPKGLYIQYGEEKHSGIYVYFIAAANTNIKVGDNVKVGGILDRHEGKARIRTNIEDILIMSSGEMPYKPVNINYFTALSDYESMLTTIVFNKRFNLLEILSEHLIFLGEDYSKIYVKDTLSYLNHLSLYVKLESLSGILDNFNDLGRVLPRSEDDIVVSMPFCSDVCSGWESCLDENTCVLDRGRCTIDNDCPKENSTCNTETHYCEEPTLLINGNLDTWDNTSMPTGYLIGDALKVTQEENNKESSNFSARVERLDYLEDGTETVEFLSPPISVDYNKDYLFSLYLLENNYDIDAKICYKAYNFSDRVIGSGIVGDNDFTQNIDNWIQLSYTTGFISKGEIWGDLIENLSYIRIGIRLYKAHCLTDNTCPTGYEATGNGFLYIDSLSIVED